MAKKTQNAFEECKKETRGNCSGKPPDMNNFLSSYGMPLIQGVADALKQENDNGKLEIIMPVTRKLN